jgi:hypothetical protein
MTNPNRIRPRSFRRNVSILVVSLVLPLLFGCEPAAPAPCLQSADERHQELLVGINLLADTLADESKLNLLNFFKKITFRGSVEEVDELISALSAASGERAGELEKLRKLEPVVTGRPERSSAIGDAITTLAKDVGADEMLERDGSFGIRFLLLQAQATRMIAVIAAAVSEFDTNRERKDWLMTVAKQYEDYRHDIIDVVTVYMSGEGMAQQEE